MLRGMITVAAAVVSVMNKTVQLSNVTITPNCTIVPTSQPTTRIVFNTKTGYREV